MFRTLIARFWADEDGAVIATEYLMLGSIVAAGSTTGLVAMRDAMVSEYQDFGESVKDIRKTYGVTLPKKQSHALPTTHDYAPIVVGGFEDDRPTTPAYRAQYAGVSP
jgi:Flp pilus assembly pilin Flp